MAEKKQTIDYFKVMHPVLVLTLVTVALCLLQFFPDMLSFLFFALLFPFFIAMIPNAGLMVWVLQIMSIVLSLVSLGYFLAIVVQFVTHIRRRQEKTLFPLWLMLSTVLTFIGSLFELLGFNIGLAVVAFVLSCVYYILYLRCQRSEVLEKYRSDTKFRYLLWGGMIFGIMLAFI